MWSVLIHWRSFLVSFLWQHFNNPKTEELPRTLKSRQMWLLEKRMIQCKSLFSVQNMQRFCSLLFPGRGFKQGVCRGWSLGGFCGFLPLLFPPPPLLTWTLRSGYYSHFLIPQKTSLITSMSLYILWLHVPVVQVRSFMFYLSNSTSEGSKTVCP